MFQNGCFYFLRGCWFEENFLYFHFLLWGSCLPFWKKQPVSLKLRVLLIEGLGRSVRFKTLLSPLSPKPPWEIFMKGLGDISVTWKKNKGH